MDFPSTRLHKPMLSVVSREAIGTPAQALGSGAFATAAWPGANRAIYVPITLSAPYKVSKVWWLNGTTANLNVDCGVYTRDGTLLGSIGSTAQSATSVLQSAALSLFLLPGSYLMALALSGTTGHIIRGNPTARFLQVAGVAQQASAFPLPATATPANLASAYLPMFGIASAVV